MKTAGSAVPAPALPPKKYYLAAHHTQAGSGLRSPPDATSQTACATSTAAFSLIENSAN